MAAAVPGSAVRAVLAASAQANMDAGNNAKANADIARALELDPHNAMALKMPALRFVIVAEYGGALRSLDEDLRANTARGRRPLYARARLVL
jgi:hypothetical protein